QWRRAVDPAVHGDGTADAGGEDQQVGHGDSAVGGDRQVAGPVAGARGDANVVGDERIRVEGCGHGTKGQVVGNKDGGVIEQPISRKTRVVRVFHIESARALGDRRISNQVSGQRDAVVGGADFSRTVDL